MRQPNEQRRSEVLHQQMSEYGDEIPSQILKKCINSYALSVFYSRFGCRGTHLTQGLAHEYCPRPGSLCLWCSWISFVDDGVSLIIQFPLNAFAISMTISLHLSRICPPFPPSNTTKPNGLIR